MMMPTTRMQIGRLSSRSGIAILTLTITVAAMFSLPLEAANAASGGAAGYEVLCGTLSNRGQLSIRLDPNLPLRSPDLTSRYDNGTGYLKVQLHRWDGLSGRWVQVRAPRYARVPVNEFSQTGPWQLYDGGVWRFKSMSTSINYLDLSSGYYTVTGIQEVHMPDSRIYNRRQLYSGTWTYRLSGVTPTYKPYCWVA